MALDIEDINPTLERMLRPKEDNAIGISDIYSHERPGSGKRANSKMSSQRNCWEARDKFADHVQCLYLVMRWSLIGIENYPSHIQDFCYEKLGKIFSMENH